LVLLLLPRQLPSRQWKVEREALDITPAAWLVGTRAGLNLDSRSGLLRLEYGPATESRRAVFIRLGRIL
jgi:hypothetical protein